MHSTDRQAILVIGATGRTGRHVVDGLLAEGATVRALARTPSTAGLPAAVDVVAGDLDDPASVARAAAGADAAFLLWHRFDVEGADAVVAALAEHVEHVVYLSAARLQDGDDGPMPGVWADVEGLLAAADVPHTFVRGGGFAANTLQWAPQIRAGEPVTIPFPAAARSLVDERDLADVAVHALLRPADHAGAAYAVTGPEVLTQAEQVGAIGAALGRAVEVREQPEAEAHREAAEQGGEAWATASLRHWRSLVDRPELVRDDAERVTGHPARPFAAWAHDNADAFRVLSTATVAGHAPGG